MKKILKGTIANKGKIEGKVFVIKNRIDIDKFKAGDILVTKMTTPFFVPAMINAAAIITDIGGITCHAAIVSRELGVPCIVGTEKATSILKTGQSIIVDADNGDIYVE